MMEWDENTIRKAVKILLNGAVKQFNIDNPVINLAYVYGIIEDSNGIAKVSNRIFEQRIYNYYTSKTETIY